ncbi:MAG: hypothetical protein AB1705_04565 [Verrucomicrobiota bacterium]
MAGHTASMAEAPASQTRTFTAGTAAEALRRIRAELGPDAVVLNVKRIPARGWSRLWRSGRIEVIAQRPPIGETRAINETPSALRGPLSNADSPSGTRSNLAALLEETGLLPVYARQLTDCVDASTAPDSPELSTRIGALHEWMSQLWASRAAPAPSGVHVFVGPAGAGKTTALCKWLAQTVLAEGRLARVLRLDGVNANTAEFLDVFAETLGVPVERLEDGAPGHPAEVLFVDLPGSCWQSAEALRDLGGRVSRWRGAQVHLVLNASYDTALLLAQARAYAALPITDVVFTHLDEERRWGKMWNVWLGTNYTISRLGAGQNLPGEFHIAEAGLILRRQFQGIPPEPLQ